MTSAKRWEAWLNKQFTESTTPCTALAVIEGLGTRLGGTFNFNYIVNFTPSSQLLMTRQEYGGVVHVNHCLSLVPRPIQKIGS